MPLVHELRVAQRVRPWLYYWRLSTSALRWREEAAVRSRGPAFLQAQQRILGATTFADLVRRAETAVATLLHASSATIFLVDTEARGGLGGLWTSGRQQPTRLERCAAGHVAKTWSNLNIYRRGGRLVHESGDPVEDSWEDLRSGVRVRTLLCIPVIGADKELVAVLQVVNKMREGEHTLAPSLPGCNFVRARAGGHQDTPHFVVSDEQLLHQIAAEVLAVILQREVAHRQNAEAARDVHGRFIVRRLHTNAGMGKARTAFELLREHASRNRACCRSVEHAMTRVSRSLRLKSLRRVARRLSSTPLRWSMHLWARWTAETGRAQRFAALRNRHLRALARKFALRAASGATRRAWSLWSAACTQLREEHMAEQMAAMRDANALHMHHTARVMLAGRLARRTKDLVRRGFCSWSTHTLQLADHEHASMDALSIIARTVRTFQHLNMRCAFLTWVHIAEEARVHQHGVRKAALRWRCTRLAAVFGAWEDSTWRRQRCRGIISRLAGRQEHVWMAVGLRVWTEFVEQCWQDDVEIHRREVVVERALRRIRNRTVHLLFSRWRDMASQQKRVALETRQRLNIAATKMKQRAVIASMNTWIEYYEARLRAKYLAGKVFGAMLHGQMGAAFGSWRQRIREHIAHAADEGRQQLVVQRCVAKLKHRIAHAAFISWMQTVEALVRERCGLRQIMVRTLRRMDQAFLLAGFQSWGAWVAEVQHHEAIVGRFLARMQQSAALKSFQKWLHTTKERRWLRRLLGRLFALQRQRSLLGGLVSWKALCSGATSVEMMAASARIQEMEERIANMESHAAYVRAQMVKKVMASWQLGARTRCFRAWQEHFRAARHSRQGVLRVVRRVLHRVIGRAFVGWNEFCVARKRLRESTARALRMWQNGALARVYRPWVAIAKERARRRLVMKRFSAKLRNGQVARALLAWDDFVERRLRAKTLVQKVSTRCEKILESKGFRGWRAAAAAMQQGEAARVAKRNRALKIVAQMAQGKLVHAFRGWSAGCAYEKHQRHTVAAFVRRIQNQVGNEHFWGGSQV
jgi:hypothetical protein